jgi:hypothetical protein
MDGMTGDVIKHPSRANGATQLIPPGFEDWPVCFMNHFPSTSLRGSRISRGLSLTMSLDVFSTTVTREDDIVLRCAWFHNG